MTIFTSLLGSFRLSLIVVPILAIVITSLTGNDAFVLLSLWSVALLNAFGYDVFEHLYGLEFEIYFTLLIAFKTLYLVQENMTSLYWWGAVIALELIYQLLKATGWGRSYLDDWRYTVVDEELSVVKTQSKADAKREDIDNMSIKSTLLLGGAMVGPAALLVIMEWYFDYNSQFEWYDNEYTGNLAMITLIGEAFVALVLVLRLSSQLHLGAENFSVDIAGVVFLYLYLQSTELLVGNNNAASQIIIACQILFTLTALIYVRHQMTRQQGGYTNSIVSGITEMLFVFVDILTSPPVIQVFFIVFTATIAAMSSNVLMTSLLTLPESLTLIVCIPYDFLNDVYQPFVAVRNDPLYGTLMTPIAPEIGKFQSEVYIIVAPIYLILEQICLGPQSIVILQNDWIVFIAMMLPIFPCLVIISQVFEEARAVVQRSWFWAISASIVILGIIVFQIGADVNVSIFYFLLVSTYTRSYTNAGYAVTLAQIFLLLLCLFRWYQLVEEENLREKEKKSLLDKTIVPVVKNVSHLVVTAVNAVSNPGVIMIGVALLAAIYLISTDFLITGYSISQASSNLPHWLIPDGVDKAQAAGVSVAKLFSKKFAAAIEIMVALISLLVRGDAFTMGIINGVIGGVEGLLSSAINAIMGQVAGALGSGQFNTISSFLGGMPSMVDIKGFDIANFPSWGFHLMRFPTWLVYLAAAVAAVIVLINVYLFFFNSAYIKTALTAIKIGVGELLLTAVIYIVKAFVYLQGRGYLLSFTINSSILWAYGLVLVVLLIGITLETLTLLDIGGTDARKKSILPGSSLAAPEIKVKPVALPVGFSLQTRYGEQRSLMGSQKNSYDFPERRRNQHNHRLER